MGIMAGGTVFHHPFPGPMAHTLTMCPADPVLFLPEMAFPAEGVGMVHINVLYLAGVEKITILLAVTGITVQGA